MMYKRVYYLTLHGINHVHCYSYYMIYNSLNCTCVHGYMHAAYTYYTSYCGMHPHYIAT